jgi:hypothetical protein
VLRTRLGRVTVLAGVLLAASARSVTADPIAWVNWTSATLGTNGAAAGSMASGSGTIGVVYGGEVATPTQVTGGINYWVPADPYLSSTVANVPLCCDIIALAGGTAQQNTLTFSSPVTNPVMAIVSLGQPGFLVSYEFAEPFEVLSSGPGFWGAPGTLTELPGGILEGNEGHGVIRFPGTVSSISWIAPTAEFWHGFTLGVAADTAEPAPVPEPATLTLLAVGLAGAAGQGFRSRRSRKC